MNFPCHSLSSISRTSGKEIGLMYFLWKSSVLSKYVMKMWHSFSSAAVHILSVTYRCCKTDFHSSIQPLAKLLLMEVKNSCVLSLSTISFFYAKGVVLDLFSTWQKMVILAPPPWIFLIHQQQKGDKGDATCQGLHFSAHWNSVNSPETALQIKQSYLHLLWTK